VIFILRRLPTNTVQPPMKSEEKLSNYLNPSNPFAQLSMRDLLEARERYHVHLMRHPNVVATAVGRYRIRSGDSWPDAGGSGKVHGTGPRTLGNSEVRPYSWPAILVFVQSWIDSRELAMNPQEGVPVTLYLEDGRAVPVCVIEAPHESAASMRADGIRYPVNNIGGGNPVIAKVQGREYAATIACLVSDGHKIFALTNSHVTGDAGEVIYSVLDGVERRIGVSAGQRLTREEFTKVYPGLPGRDTYVRQDIGLIDLDDLARWTTEVGEIGQMGPLVDLSISNTLSLVGCHVRGIGAASGEIHGEIHALFYRYKEEGGYEYVADLLIGPRSASTETGSSLPLPAFATHPGDSGAMWLLEPIPQKATAEAPVSNPKKKAKSHAATLDGVEPQGISPLRPLAIQWGRNMLYSAGVAQPQSYALATFASQVCNQLGVDLLRDWNVDQPDTWGALGHFSIAARSLQALSGRFPGLVTLVENHLTLISRDDQDLDQGSFKGFGSQSFVPLADVPDFYWKPRISTQGHARPLEGPNHFADMDQPGPDGRTLLDLCTNEDFIDPDKWNAFYESVKDLLKGTRITAMHRGLLPFRVWQIFDAMAGYAASGDTARFLCAAGVLTHYAGDACQPLHISYLHDGDPLQPYTYTYSSGKKAGTSEARAGGDGVHSAYEDDMVFTGRKEILTALMKTPKVTANEGLDNGREAAKATIAMMRKVFTKLPPKDIVATYIDLKANGEKPAAMAQKLWKQFGKKTISAMQDGTHLVALLWESAWEQGNGDANLDPNFNLTEAGAMAICADKDFLPSVTIDKISALLAWPQPV
jgi:hypothetical protein